MSHFKIYVTPRIDFDNGYSMSFEPAAGLPTLYCTLRYKGDPTDIGRFMSSPSSNDGFLAYLSPEAFAEVLYRISKEEKKDA